MSMKPPPLSRDAVAKVQAALGPDCEWRKRFPKEDERITADRAAKEKIVARVLADEATRQAREADAAAREATALLARLPNAGGRYGH